MVPDIAKKGHSFQGAFAYYLHDKRQEGHPHPDTAERVAWTQTRNLMTDDPDGARKIMIATALQSDQLKKEAGIKSTGRKSSQHVYAYSLAWAPEESDDLTRDEMLSAVDASLKELKAENLQAVVVCHTDQNHPHVHVIVNRVDPSDGRMHPFKNDRIQLSEWANKYERDRGKILTPKREEKRQQRLKNPDQKSRQEYARQQFDQAKQKDMSPAGMLKDLTHAQAGRHREEWRQLSASNKSKRTAIYDDFRGRIKQAAALHKQHNKALWAEHFRKERERKKAYKDRETNILGVVQNAIEATSYEYMTGELNGTGKLSAHFANVLSSQKRAAIFDDRLEKDRKQMYTDLKSVLDVEVNALKQQRKEALAAQRSSFDQSRTELKTRHDGEWKKIDEAWKQLKERSRGGSTSGSTKSGSGSQRTKTRLWIHSPKNEARISRLDRRASNAQMKAQKRQPEKDDLVKQDFDKGRKPNAEKPKTQPTKKAAVSTPSPAPTPSGEVPRTTAKRVEVPAKQWKQPAPTAKTKGLAGTPSTQKDWSKTGASKPKAEKPKDWSKKVEKSGGTKKAPTPKRDLSRS